MGSFFYQRNLTVVRHILLEYMLRGHFIKHAARKIGLTQTSAIGGMGNKYRLMVMVLLFGWEGNHRSDVAPAIRN